MEDQNLVHEKKEYVNLNPNNPETCRRNNCYVTKSFTVLYIVVLSKYTFIMAFGNAFALL